MQVVGIEGRTAWRALRPAWEEAYAADPHAEVFVSFAWLDSWLQIAPQRWFVLAARPSSSEQPVAFLPLALHERRRWGVPLLRELSMAGKPHAPLTGLVVHADHEGPALEALSRALREDFAWDRFHLDEVIDPRIEVLLADFDRAGFHVRRADPLCCPILELPASWEDYLACCMSHKGRFNLRRNLRQLEALEGYRVTTPSAETVEREIAVLLALWQARWGALSDDVCRTYHHMYATAFAEGRLFMRTLWEGESPIASLAAYLDREKGTISYYTSGFDAAYARFSPGKVIVGQCIRDAIAEGHRVFDFLVGGHDYKLRFFGAKERYAIRATVARPSLRRRVGERILGLPGSR